MCVKCFPEIYYFLEWSFIIHYDGLKLKILNHDSVAANICCAKHFITPYRHKYC